MKRTSNKFFAQLSNIEIKNLSNQVKETIALGIHSNNVNKVFTIKDLWKLQRQLKPRVIRRFF